MNFINIKTASFENYPLVAWTALTASDMDTDNMGEIVKSCSDEKSMYSWKNSIVAYDGDEIIGYIICYEGDRYELLRQYT